MPFISLYKALKAGGKKINGKCKLHSLDDEMIIIVANEYTIKIPAQVDGGAA